MRLQLLPLAQSNVPLLAFSGQFACTTKSRARSEAIRAGLRFFTAVLTAPLVAAWLTPESPGREHVHIFRGSADTEILPVSSGATGAASMYMLPRGRSAIRTHRGPDSKASTPLARVVWIVSHRFCPPWGRIVLPPFGYLLGWRDRRGPLRMQIIFIEYPNAVQRPRWLCSLLTSSIVGTYRSPAVPLICFNFRADSSLASDDRLMSGASAGPGTTTFSALPLFAWAILRL